MPIVRRFLLAPSFARLIRKERGSQRVTEGYFPTQSGRNSHVLLDGSLCQLVLVTPEDGMASEERTEVPRAHADALLDVCAGRTVYERARVPVGGGREALVDRITHPGVLDLVSVEFEDREEAASFLFPAWFGPEVTADAGFDRRGIALQGVPAVGDVPLTDAALEALLDTLEDRFGRARFAAPAPRRATNDSSVIDALRRLATPDQASADAAPEAGEDASARPLPRSNFAIRSEGGESQPAPEGEANADTRIDDVIASLSQALGNQAAPAPAAPEESAPAMPDVARPVTRLRRFGA
jgi:CYTH domain-containing protein